MKKLWLRILLGYLLFNLVLGIAFVSGGGMQMVSGLSLPPTPAVNTPEADLEYFRQLVLANEQGATDAQRCEFEARVNNAKAPTNPDEMTLLAMHALAAFDNAHTTVLKTRMYRLPVRFLWAADELIIVKTRPDFQHLLGHKVTAIGQQTPDALARTSSRWVGGGTPNWQKYRSEFLLTAPSALAQMGVTIDGGQVQIDTLDADGNSHTHLLVAEDELAEGDPFWDFRHQFPGNESFGTAGWVTLLNEKNPLPLYLRHTQTLHLLEYLPTEHAMYLRMNGSLPDHNETLDELAARIDTVINTHAPEHFIVDFRFNRGGDYTQVLPIVKTIAGAVAADGKLYVIVGPNTFSAGIIAASQFKRFAPEQLVLVGSGMGDDLRFRAEGFYPGLPASGIQLYLTKGWTDLVNGCNWFDDCWLPNKILLRAVDRFDIHIPVENTWASYRSGQDRVMQAIQMHLAQSPQ